MRNVPKSINSVNTSYVLIYTTSLLFQVREATTLKHGRSPHSIARLKYSDKSTSPCFQKMCTFISFIPISFTAWVRLTWIWSFRSLSSLPERVPFSYPLPLMFFLLSRSLGSSPTPFQYGSPLPALSRHTHK